MYSVTIEKMERRITKPSQRTVAVASRPARQAAGAQRESQRVTAAIPEEASPLARPADVRPAPKASDEEVVEDDGDEDSDEDGED